VYDGYTIVIDIIVQYQIPKHPNINKSTPKNPCVTLSVSVRFGLYDIDWFAPSSGPEVPPQSLAPSP